MDYRAWLTTFQTHEQAARSAYSQVAQLADDLARAVTELAHVRANHAHLSDHCRYLAQRKDLPVDRIPAFHQHVAEIARLRAENIRLKAAIAVDATEAATRPAVK